MAVDKYLRLLAERAQDVFDHDPGGTYPQSLAASWAVAFDRLAADNPTALDLLTVLAWCGPEPVPLFLLTGHPDSLPVSLWLIATDPLMFARCTRSCIGAAWPRCHASILLGLDEAAIAGDVGEQVAQLTTAAVRPRHHRADAPGAATCKFATCRLATWRRFGHSGCNGL
jgi:hypothetical protein